MSRESRKMGRRVRSWAVAWLSFSAIRFVALAWVALSVGLGVGLNPANAAPVKNMSLLERSSLPSLETGITGLPTDPRVVRSLNVQSVSGYTQFGNQGSNGYESALRDIESLFLKLGSDATEELLDQGVEHDTIALTTRAHLRYAGSETALPVEISEPRLMRRDFEALHERQFGFVSPEKSLVIATLEVEALSESANSQDPIAPVAKVVSQGTDQTVLFYSQGRWHEAPLYIRSGLSLGQTLSGPALVIEPHQTVVVEDGWSLDVSARNDLILTRTTKRSHENLSSDADPVLLEVFNNRFMAIAEQMGEALRSTAQSVNIKERLDFSCAVFDPKGGLVSNAPHLPVHLGSMDRSVESVIRAHGAAMRPGDVYMLNAPYNGGTHLPDITVVTPVFDERGQNILFFTASRGHHEDIGGLTPGSMTPRPRLKKKAFSSTTQKL